MLVGRQRRARALAVLVCITIGFFLYERNAPIATQYADYVREKAVGGGAVLRGPDELSHGQDRVDATSSAVHQPTTILDFHDKHPTTTSVKARPTPPPALGQDKTPSLPADTQFDYAQNVHALDKAQQPVEVGEGRNVISTNRPTTKSPIHWTKPTEQFPLSSTIQLPTNSPKPIPLIQYNGKGKADAERLAAVKEATKHAWKGYTSKALGFDEVRPVSGDAKNSFNGWGATLVDSLDTLWIMGMTKEFEEAVDQVQKIDFTTSSRSDIPLFEVTIRYLGGLLAAYDVSNRKYRVLLDKAVELAEILYGAFDTPNRMPVTYYQWKPAFNSQPHRAGSRVVLAELGTLNMEFTRLAQMTGEPKYYDAIARVTDAFEEWQNSTRLPGMWPTWVDASGCQLPTQRSSYANNFREQLTPETGDRKSVAGPPSFYNSKDAAGAQQTKDDGLSLSELHELADKSSFADDVRDLSGPGAPKGKRQLLMETKKPTKVSDLSSDREVVSRTKTAGKAKDMSTGEEVCLHAGLNSTSIGGSETFTLGGMSDSVYEYLPKEYLLLGGRLNQYKSMYLDSISTIIEKLLFRPMTPEGRDILFTGDMQISLNWTTQEPIETRRYKSEHLSCFVGGMFAMGGKIFQNPQHVEIGRKLTDGCIWAYNSTASGIMPETFILSACPSLERCAWNQTQYNEELDPFSESRQTNPENFRKKVYHKDRQSGSNSKVSVKNSPTSPQLESQNTKTQLKSVPQAPGTKNTQDETLYKRQLGEASLDIPKPADVETVPSYQGHHRAGRLQHNGEESYQPSNTYSSPEDEDDPSEYDWVYETSEDYVRAKVQAERLPPGFADLTSRAYILRPEAIESVFYMYRITGEQHWRDAGWQMFRAVENATRAEFGHSAVHDVTQAEAFRTNQMESFWIAETLKYFYLLFDDPATWSLDDWVLNTEAHFFRRPESPRSS